MTGGEVTHLVADHELQRVPVAALAAPALVVLLSPVWLLAPLTIACGFSVPPWILGRLWGDPRADGARRPGGVGSPGA